MYGIRYGGVLALDLEDIERVLLALYSKAAVLEVSLRQSTGNPERTDDKKTSKESAVGS